MKKKTKSKSKTEKKIKHIDIDGVFHLTRGKKIMRVSEKGTPIISVTTKELERLALYTKQRKEMLTEIHNNGHVPLGMFVVRLSEDVTFMVDDRKKK